jgi:hypothetical protein
MGFRNPELDYERKVTSSVPPSVKFIFDTIFMMTTHDDPRFQPRMMNRMDEIG